jgi:hypothetical protein
MIGSGVFKVTIDEEEVGFHFGMLASAYTEQKAGMPIFKVFQHIATGHGSMQILQYFYGGAMAYKEFNETDTNVTIASVSYWIERMGLEKTMEIYSASVQSPISKNGKAPKEEAGLKAE